MTANARPYERVAFGLRGRIAAGEWQPGELIPGRRALAAEYGVAPATLERAAGMLIAEGLLSASDRRGTFVAGLPVSSRNEAYPASTTHWRRDAIQATVGIIAAVVPYSRYEERAGQWSAQVLAACEQGLSGERGLTQRFLNLVAIMGKDITPVQAVKQLLADRVDAIVVIGHSDLDEALTLVETASVPLVCAEYDPIVASVPQVCFDSVAGGVLAVKHLRERGYRHLTYLRPFVSDWAEARLAGARRASGVGGLRVFPGGEAKEVSVNGDDQTAAGLETGRALLAVGFEPGTGVVAPNDSVALGFIAAARERGLEAGRDYGIVGFDDRHREAHLTSLRPPLEQMGREAAGLVMRLLRGEAAPARIALQHQLIARASTAPIGGGNPSRRGIGLN